METKDVKEILTPDSIEEVTEVLDVFPNNGHQVSKMKSTRMEEIIYLATMLLLMASLSPDRNNSNEKARN